MQKSILKVFFKNLCKKSNASYLAMLNSEVSISFFMRQLYFTVMRKWNIGFHFSTVHFSTYVSSKKNWWMLIIILIFLNISFSIYRLEKFPTRTIQTLSNKKLFRKFGDLLPYQRHQRNQMIKFWAHCIVQFGTVLTKMLWWLRWTGARIYQLRIQRLNPG